jgi:hypothetical protein
MSAPAPVTERRFHWGWWLPLLIGVGLLVLLVIGLRNMKRPLTPADLAAARERWIDKGPASYTLIYTVHLPDHAEPDRYVIKVRDKKTVEGTVNDLPIERLHNYGMTRLFDNIEEFLKLQSAKGKTAHFLAGDFDPQTGALRWFARREMGGKDMVEITVEAVQVEIP